MYISRKPKFNRLKTQILKQRINTRGVYIKLFHKVILSAVSDGQLEVCKLLGNNTGREDYKQLASHSIKLHIVLT